MREQQRYRVRAFALLVNEVEVDAAQRDLELPKAVEDRFLRAPVEAIAPVGDEVLQVGDAAAGRPGRPRRLVRPANARQPLPQVAQRLVRNMQSEGLWQRLAHGWSSESGQGSQCVGNQRVLAIRPYERRLRALSSSPRPTTPRSPLIRHCFAGGKGAPSLLVSRRVLARSCWRSVGFMFRRSGPQLRSAP